MEPYISYGKNFSPVEKVGRNLIAVYIIISIYGISWITAVTRNIFHLIISVYSDQDVTIYDFTFGVYSNAITLTAFAYTADPYLGEIVNVTICRVPLDGRLCDMIFIKRAGLQTV